MLPFVSRNDDPVPPGLLLSLDEAFRVLEALEDASLTMEETDVAPDCGTNWRQ
jgi:hypothetical protein